MDFKNLKTKNLEIANKFLSANLLEDYNLLNECATFMTYENIADGSIFLKRTNFCKSKFCPICNENRKIKHKTKILHISEYLNINDKDSYHLIITLKNCNLSNIKNTIDLLKKSWIKIIRTVAFKGKLFSYIYYIHVKYEKNTINKYHVHMHAIIIYNTNNTDLDNEVEKWRNTLKKTAKLSYDPLVIMIKIKDKWDLMNKAGYCAQGIDVSDIPNEELNDLKEQLYKVKLIQPAQQVNKLFKIYNEKMRCRKYIKLPYYISVKKWDGKNYKDEYAYDPVTYSPIIDN